MQVLIKAFSDGKTQIVTIEPSESLKKLFQKVSELRGVDVQYIRLVYAGKEYGPDDHGSAKSLADLGIKDRSTVVVVTRQPGGAIFAGQSRDAYSNHITHKQIIGNDFIIQSDFLAVEQFVAMDIRRGVFPGPSPILLYI
ncbi:hypothetical protein ScPMuIL_003103 [Solemya velum]